MALTAKAQVIERDFQLARSKANYPAFSEYARRYIKHNKDGIGKFFFFPHCEREPMRAMRTSERRRRRRRQIERNEGCGQSTCYYRIGINHDNQAVVGIRTHFIGNTNWREV
jgi:hypothetical protein